MSYCILEKLYGNACRLYPCKGDFNTAIESVAGIAQRTISQLGPLLDKYKCEYYILTFEQVHNIFFRFSSVEVMTNYLKEHKIDDTYVALQLPLTFKNRMVD